MKKQISNALLVGGLLLLIAAVLAGCKSTPGQRGPSGRYAITVELAPDLKGSSVIVDLVGINSSSQPIWMDYDMAKYWQPGDPRRKDAEPNRRTFSFVSGQSTSYMMPADDPLWDKWMSEGVSDVLVLADLPPPQASRPGLADARRQMLTLDKLHWPKKTKELKVSVKHSGIDVLTPPRQ